MKRETLQHGRADALRRDEVARYGGIVNRGEDGGVGISRGDLCEDALRAAALVEVIMDESDVQCSA
jgi:hypothetical protein